jgi:invasion protein IalB
MFGLSPMLAGRSALVALAAGGTIALFSVAAEAQQRPPAGAPAVPAAPGAPATPTPAQLGQAAAPNAPQPEWVKVCSTDPNSKKEVCLISRDVRAETGQTIASVALREIKGEPKRFFLAAMPPGLLIQPGIRIVVDQREPQPGKFSICFPNACYAEVEVKDDFVPALKKGTQIIIQAMNQQAKTVGFPVTLGGFTKAYDGPPLDPKLVADQQQKLQDELTRRAEEARKRYLDAGQAGGPAVPAAQVPTPN